MVGAAFRNLQFLADAQHALFGEIVAGHQLTGFDPVLIGNAGKGVALGHFVGAGPRHGRGFGRLGGRHRTQSRIFPGAGNRRRFGGLGFGHGRRIVEGRRAFRGLGQSRSVIVGLIAEDFRLPAAAGRHQTCQQNHMNRRNTRQNTDHFLFHDHLRSPTPLIF
ncbi:hypothetical protein SDC9_136595 [bioreactor metagenome]|uniref:Uncharacterized protein n=1 Tax=bioreactor metagenome TaxID=1076179 RepID=A0A645DJK3_9ZZZZ